jgi:ubiquinone/menaquinone biosynthesis C-methylase UbiE/uncharacterized protein YbaR (Trm112 family)
MSKGLLCCVACRGQLACSDSQVTCTTCGRSWPIILGVPDFRDRASRYVQDDLEQAARLQEVFYTKSRDELVTLAVRMGSFYHDDRATDRLQAQRVYNRQAWQQRAQEMSARLVQLRSVWGRDHFAVGADIGCGSGPNLVSLAAICDQVVGIDASLSELILARKLLDQEKINNVELACAYAEALPIPSQSVDLAISMYVLEHVTSPAQSLIEASGVLKPSAKLYFAVPYRYALIPPEPHTHVWWVGWLPRRWQASYVRFFKPGFEYNIHLFSFGEIADLALHTGAHLCFVNFGFDPCYPPLNERYQRIWRVLRHNLLLLRLASWLARKSIHAVLTRPMA